MNANTVLAGATLLSCLVGVSIIMWLMNKHMNVQSIHPDRDAHALGTPSELLVALRKRTQLEAEIAERNRVAELAVKRNVNLGPETERKR